MNILELIKADHQKVEKLFSEVESAKDAKKLQKLFEQLYVELNLHALAEELVFYPALREYEEAEDLLEEAEEEHTQTKELLEELKLLQAKAPEFKEKMLELKEAVQHHVEEEESEVFDLVQEVMEDEELQELGQEFQDAKSRVQEDIAAAIQ